MRREKPRLFDASSIECADCLPGIAKAPGLSDQGLLQRLRFEDYLPAGAGATAGVAGVAG